MKVKELIVALQGLPDKEAEVEVSFENAYGCSPGGIQHIWYDVDDNTCVIEALEG